MGKKIGLTKDAGWQFGIRKSIPININEIWEFLFSEKGSKIWLRYVENEFSTYKNLSHIRTKWKLNNWTNEATLQMRVISNKEKTTISFHIDQLLDENQRQEAKIYWSETLVKIEKQLSQIKSYK